MKLLQLLCVLHHYYLDYNLFSLLPLSPQEVTVATEVARAAVEVVVATEAVAVAPSGKLAALLSLRIT